VNVADRRLRNVLGQRIAATSAQLDVKICESGPPDQRPDPHIVSAALAGSGHFQRRRFKGSTDPNDPHLWFLAGTDPALLQQREDQIHLPYDLYRFLSQRKSYCGDVLEKIVSASFEMAAGYIPTAPRQAASPLDHVYELEGIRLGVEDKNIRAWQYPHTAEIWKVLKKCILEDAQPLLIARKIQWLTFRVFSEIGAMGFEFHRQVFAENTSSLLRDIQHTDLLGFKDVIAVKIAPHPPLVTFLDTTLRKNLPEFARRWAEHRGIVEEYAVTQDLSSLGPLDRGEASGNFVREVLHGGGPVGWEEYFGVE
jgi:hypothetical protein